MDSSMLEHETRGGGCTPEDSCILQEGECRISSSHIASDVIGLQKCGEVVPAWVLRICLINQHIHLAEAETVTGEEQTQQRSTGDSMRVLI